MITVKYPSLESWHWEDDPGFAFRMPAISLDTIVENYKVVDVGREEGIEEEKGE